MKALLLSAIGAAFVLSCTSTAIPKLAPWTPGLDYSHVDEVMHDHFDSLGQNCWNLLPETTSSYYIERAEDDNRMWIVHTFGNEWRVRQTGLASGEVVESPKWLENLGCG